MIRHSVKASESWKNLPWKKFRRDLFRLQRRVFKAVQAGNKRKARFLQKLILKSKAGRFLAIRQISQLNAGKKTAGIDGVKSLDFNGRFELEITLKQSSGNWHHQELREIPIPKKDGTTRMLKIPTIADRCWQCLAKYALEPAHEATFHARSYGFRTGRAAHDAQQFLFSNLSSKAKRISKRVIELDIEKCFDRINHSTIMENLIAPKGIKLGIYRCLKAGINPEFPEQGTPQGGVVSPLLANIALNGIESIHRYHKDNQRITNKTPESDIRYPSVRYADDMVIVLRPQDDANEILAKIEDFLNARGMKVSAKKTKITATTDGFDFLGWHIIVQSNGKFNCTPSEENFKKFRQKVKAIVNCSNYGSSVKAEKLAPIVRGWRNYHRFCDMSGSRFSLWFLSKRTHTVFNKETKNDHESSIKLAQKAFPKVPCFQNSYVMVKGDKSPYDGDLTYWSERNSKLYDGETSKTIKKQNHTCGYCGLKCTSEERVHLHHIDGNHKNRKPKNLIVVHESCHDYIHMGKRVTP
ncbi:reverse transcriptase domain-containing protein (plasmid) [Anabaena sp. FACHB-709]|nr:MULTISPECIES: reverse transcriptase domain-containing protein [Nostocaceae]MBD2267027.1 reverse transcriptase N-terminal domain-containing protein [Anabaena sp. FACHB-709]MBD2276577.1 reverse transcriptase N-terminal domain-containing protein [Nostoc sp. PCC 7120 = FACHB-418]RUR72815.1 group II intron reverse transcriptase/maturase [Nostoc sp. PCC 7120 = FACHB-418]